MARPATHSIVLGLQQNGRSATIHNEIADSLKERLRICERREGGWPRADACHLTRMENHSDRTGAVMGGIWNLDSIRACRSSCGCGARRESRIAEEKSPATATSAPGVPRHLEVAPPPSMTADCSCVWQGPRRHDSQTFRGGLAEAATSVRVSQFHAARRQQTKKCAYACHSVVRK